MTRIVAVDFARFLAVVGMMGAHLLPSSAPDAALVAVTGFPSSAFAVIGGVSAILATRRYSEDGRHLAAALSLAARGAVVAALGLVLQPLGWPILVVLTYFGAGLVCLALLLRLPTWALLVLGGALAVAGPVLNLAVRDAVGHPDSERISFASPLDFLASLGFTGTYPVVTWLVYMLIGAAIGRMLVRTRAPTRRPGLVLSILGAVGLTTALLAVAVTGGAADPGDEADGAPIGRGIRLLVDATPHSGSLGDIVRTASATVLVLGLLMLATRAGGRAPRLLVPVRAAGAAPLTIYSAHVLSVGLGGLDGTSAYIASVVAALIVGGVLAVLQSRGPLEAAVGAVASAAASLSPGRPRVATGPEAPARPRSDRAG